MNVTRGLSSVKNSCSLGMRAGDCKLNNTNILRRRFSCYVDTRVCVHRHFIALSERIDRFFSSSSPTDPDVEPRTTIEPPIAISIQVSYIR